MIPMASIRPAIGRLALAAALVAQLTLAGCASTGGRTASGVHDPLEPLNRVVHGFNETLDDALLEPTARAYNAVVPDMFRFLIGNFFSNLGDFWTAGNQLLQGKPREAASDLARLVINSTLGFAGLADVASEMGFEKHREDFGQTLGRWGVGTGPYLVLPLLGPSSLRDGLGLQFDLAADPLLWSNSLVAGESVGRKNNLVAARIVDTRASLLRAGRVLEGAALDKYSFVRDGYTQRRRSLVWDGDPPPEPEPDDAEATSAPGGQAPK